jgi:SAM-dependent methyltransferase
MTCACHQRLRDRLAPYVQKAQVFSGWTFDYEPRSEEAPPPWDFVARARELVLPAPTAVDLGTGGGERFAEITAGAAGSLVATEEWPVNLEVATRRLSPLGVQVLHCSSTVLPFQDNSIDLLMSRHEAIDPFETARVLAPGGTVLTQQVGNDDWPELRAFFPAWQDHGDHYFYYAAGFQAAGLRLVDHRRHYRTVAFKLEELVYQLCTMPWWVPDFDPLGRDFEAVAALERALNKSGEILLTESRYLIEAQKYA